MYKDNLYRVDKKATASLMGYGSTALRGAEDPPKSDKPPFDWKVYALPAGIVAVAVVAGVLIRK